MVLSEVIKIFEKRRAELYNILTQRRDELKPEIQHQMYGAMNEIDIFLRTLEYYKEKQADKEISSMVLIAPTPKEGFMKRVVSKIKKKAHK